MEPSRQLLNFPATESSIEIHYMAYAHMEDKYNTLLTEFHANMPHSVVQHFDVKWHACRTE